jgi:putative transposase
VYRIYRAEGLAVRPRKRKRLKAAARTPLAMPGRADEVWTMDFTEDALASGRKFRTLNLMDGYTREALGIEVDTSLAGVRVVRVLAQLRETRGVPERIQVDNVLTCKSRIFGIDDGAQCSPCWPWASDFDELDQAASTG